MRRLGIVLLIAGVVSAALFLGLSLAGMRLGWVGPVPVYMTPVALQLAGVLCWALDKGTGTRRGLPIVLVLLALAVLAFAAAVWFDATRGVGAS